jgi:hypothetical protein
MPKPVFCAMPTQPDQTSGEARVGRGGSRDFVTVSAASVLTL